MATPSDTKRPADVVGLGSVRSPHGFDTTLERLRAVCIQRGLTVFAIIDHRAEARPVGLEMSPTTVVIVGAPRAGTPLMLAAPTCAIDLPLKLLIREDDGVVSIIWNTGTYLGQRHGVPERMWHVVDSARDLAHAVISPP